VQLVMLNARPPRFRMPPPVPPARPATEFPLTVLLISIRLTSLLSIPPPPPDPPGLLTVLPLNVHSEIVTVAAPKSSMPPPLSMAVLPLNVLSVMVSRSGLPWPASRGRRSRRHSGSCCR